MSKQDRQGVRTAREIEQKYKLGAYEKGINEAQKKADSTRQDMQRIMEQMQQEFGSAVEEMEQIASGAENIAGEAKLAAEQAKQEASSAKSTAAEADRKSALAQQTAESATQTANEANQNASEAKSAAEDVKTGYDAFERRLQDVEKQSQDNEDIIAGLPTKNWVFNSIYPVGSIYLAYNHTNPGSLFPGTEWVRIENAFPWFTGATGTIGQTGGEREVTLTIENLPAHNHGGTYTNAGDATKTHAWLASGGSAMAYDMVNTGGGEAHNNMPPYIQISAWRRTA